MFHLIPRPLHRLALNIAHALRHRWRCLVKVQLAGVSMIGEDGAGRVLMVRHSYARPGWALPGGGMGRREDAADAVRREMREELGVELADLRRLAVLDERLSGSPHHGHIFAGRIVGEPQVDGREVVEARWFAIGDLPTDISSLTRRRLDCYLEQI